ncbi:MAG: AI-2E family transporter [Deltaproteobacteria bacterium]|jgi:predicted PurR-regulated permease PerM|nr:AI-2E family transporter [Deltaproteobacteria bacterium]
MTFSIADFAKTNRIVLIWVTFAALLYLMRDLFGLVFITFIMSFITHGIANRLYRYTKVRRKYLIAFIYVFFMVCIVLFITFGLPKIFSETKGFTEQLPKSLTAIETVLDEIAAENPVLSDAIDKIKPALTIDAITTKAFSMSKAVLEQAWKYVSWFFLSLLFSFLIMLDFPNLILKIRALRYSMIGSILEETSSSVFRFSQVVGENFRAQVYISLINTCLTITGLSFIGVGNTALLAIIVFLCGLIPVLGVIISSIPIFLVALGSPGIESAGPWVTVLACLGLIVIIHLIEAYILNPRIVSAVMHLNPVLTLMILYVAHSLMGVWGMLLGVPISVYFYRQITYSPLGRNGDAKNKLFNNGADEGGGGSPPAQEALVSSGTTSAEDGKGA